MTFDPKSVPAVADALAAGVCALVPLDGPAPWPDDDTIASTGGCYPAPAQLADGTWLGTRMILAEARRELALVGANTRAIGFPWDWDPKRSPSVSPSGTRVLLFVTWQGRGHVVEHALDGSGDWSVIASGVVLGAVGSGYLSENVWSADYAGSDDLVAVICDAKDRSGLSLLARTDRGWREVSHVKTSALQVVSRGRYLVCPVASGAQTYRALGDGLEAQLVKLGKLEARHVFVHPADTRDYLYAHAGAGKDGAVLVCDEVELRNKKVKPLKKGQLLAPRVPPGGVDPPATHEAMMAAFGHDYAARHLRPQDRTAGGRVLVTSPPTALVMRGTEVTPVANLRVLHPRLERGLAFADGGIFEVDLVTGARSERIGSGNHAFYVTVGDRVFVAIVRPREQLELHPEGTAGAPCATIDLDGASAGPGSDGALVLLGAPSKDSPHGASLQRVSPDGTSIAHAAHLVLAGPSAPDDTLIGGTRQGVARLIKLRSGLVYEVPALP